MKALPIVARFAFALFTGASVAAGNGGEWRNALSLAIPRQEIGAARVGDAVYVVGGLNLGPGFPVALDTVEVYDVPSGTWSTAAPLPVPLHHAGVAAVDGLVYVAGGYTGDFDVEGKLWIYDPGADTWSAGAELPLPLAACWAVGHGGKLYVFGGTNGAIVTRLTLIYDPLADAWSQGADMPSRREHLSASVVGDFVYVLGGRVGATVSAANERYHPPSDTWQSMAPMPTARSAMATGVFGNQIWSMGGELPILHDANEVYDVATDTWTSVEPMALPRHGMVAVPLDDGLLVPGGGVAIGFGPTAAVDIFFPDFLGTPGSISLAAGGTQTLLLDAGAAGSNDLYWIFGSATGTSPGIPLGGGLTLPLVFDAYTGLTLKRPFLGIFSGFLAFLDAKGQASASITLPAGSDPSLMGLDLFHAYTAARTLGATTYASTAVSVTLGP